MSQTLIFSFMYSYAKFIISLKYEKQLCPAHLPCTDKRLLVPREEQH